MRQTGRPHPSVFTMVDITLATLDSYQVGNNDLVVIDTFDYAVHGGIEIEGKKTNSQPPKSQIVLDLRNN